MPVFLNLGLRSLQLSMRVREAGFRRYSAKPEHVSPHTGIATSLWPSLPVVSYHSHFLVRVPRWNNNHLLSYGSETCLCLRVLRIGVM